MTDKYTAAQWYTNYIAGSTELGGFIRVHVPYLTDLWGTGLVIGAAFCVVL